MVNGYLEIYKETVEKLLQEKGMSKSEFGRRTGHATSYLPAVFSRKNPIEVKYDKAAFWGKTIGVEVPQLLEKPVDVVVREVINDINPEVQILEKDDHDSELIDAINRLAGAVEDGVARVLAALYDLWA